MERIIDDFILMAFFVGNDFLPNLPNLHINEGALALMFQKYKQILPGLGGYINEQGVINLQRLGVLLDELSEVEYRFFEAEYSDAKWINAKRNGSEEEPVKAARGPIRVSPEQKQLFKQVKKWFISPGNKDIATRQPLNLSSTLPARDRKFIQQLAADLNLQWSTKEDEEGNRFIQLELPQTQDDDESEDEESQLAITRILKRYENAKVEEATDEQAQQDLKKKYDEQFYEWKNKYYKE
ncbi:exonuclease II Exo2, partial [Exophiala xenobiotica]